MALREREDACIPLGWKGKLGSFRNACLERRAQGGPAVRAPLDRIESRGAVNDPAPLSFSRHRSSWSCSPWSRRTGQDAGLALCEPASLG
jgi:hypothetical protein